LLLDANGSLNDSDAPFAAKIRALPKYFLLEILGEPDSRAFEQSSLPRDDGRRWLTLQLSCKEIK